MSMTYICRLHVDDERNADNPFKTTLFNFGPLSLLDDGMMIHSARHPTREAASEYIRKHKPGLLRCWVITVDPIEDET